MSAVRAVLLRRGSDARSSGSSGGAGLRQGVLPRRLHVFGGGALAGVDSRLGGGPRRERPESVRRRAGRAGVLEGVLEPRACAVGWRNRLRGRLRAPDVALPRSRILGGLCRRTGRARATGGRGFLLAVVSNWDSHLPALLEGLGLARSFRAVSVSAIEETGKPEPEIFLRTCARLSVAPGEVLHVGDSLAEDYEGARAAGLQALLLDREDRHPHVEDRIRSLREIPRARFADLTTSSTHKSHFFCYPRPPTCLSREGSSRPSRSTHSSRRRRSPSTG